MRASELAGLGVGGGASLLEKVDNRPLEVLGDFVAYPCVDPDWSEKIKAKIPPDLPDIPTIERLITLPTRGVFAEAKLGHCNASEEIDNTRFWDWQQSPIPHMAPEIAPVQPVTPQAIAPDGVQATPLPESSLNIVNPPSAPDPTGMGAALSALATANIFRDMSGLSQVTDLLKKLSDNSVAIAGVAASSRGAGGSGGSSGGSGGGSVSPSSGGGGSTKTGVGVADAAREVSQQVSPSEAHDAIKLSESEMNKGNKTQPEHKTYSKQVQENVKGAQPKKAAERSIKLQINLQGYGGRLVGRFGTTVRQRDNDVGFLVATDNSDRGKLVVGVRDDYNDNRYDVEVQGEVLAGMGVNALLKGGNTVTIPRADFDRYDYFYLKAVAVIDSFDYETKDSSEITKEVAKKIGTSLEVGYEKIITMKVYDGGMEWKDGENHTTDKAVKVKVVYYTGKFDIAYDKGE